MAMPQYISGRPSFQLKQFFPKRKKNENSVFPLDQEKCYLLYSARYALAAAIQALKLGPDDAVLLPAYNCGVEIDPILHLGIKPIFYKIKKNLMVDINDLLSRINDGVRAIVVTHFLGFPQPMKEIKKICEDRNLFLIEDCAHAFLSADGENYLGSYGDVSIFSLLKTLPVPNGGVLLINNKNIGYRQNSKTPNIFSTVFYAAELLKYKTTSNKGKTTQNAVTLLNNVFYRSIASLRLLLIVFRKLFHKKGLYLVRPDSYFFIKDLSSWGISRLSKNIINETDFVKIKSIRRKNFEYLLNYFVKNKRDNLLFTQLPTGVCPLFFPIFVENERERNALYNSLRKNGITSHPWWDRFHPLVPWHEFPDAVHLKERLLGFPIHQDLTFKHLDRVINEFEKAYQNL